MRLRQQSLFDSNFQEEPFFKDQENPNFSAFDTSESLTNNPVFEPGRLGKRSDGTKISKLYAKPHLSFKFSYEYHVKRKGSRFCFA